MLCGYFSAIFALTFTSVCIPNPQTEKRSMDRTMRKKGLKGIAAVLICICFSVMGVLAAEGCRVVGNYTDEQNISLYVKGIDVEITSAECQIGTKAGQQINYENAADMENAPKTLIMIDNSLSITEANREKVHDFLTKLVDNKEEREKIAIAVFDEEIKDILSYTEDVMALKLAVDTLSYQDQETYLTDVLYEVLAKEHFGSEDCYKRIIIISDGVDNKAIGYTRDELYALIKEKAYPIYTVGCVYKENNEQLENMFAISRMTGAKEFLLDEVEDTNAMVEEITADSHAVHFTVTPEESEKDGSSKNILLTIQTAQGEQRIETQAKMPFGVQEPETETEPAAVEEESEPVQEVEPQEPEIAEPDNAEESGVSVTVIIMIVVGICLAAACVAVILSRKKKTGAKDDFEVLEETVSTAPEIQTDETVLLTADDNSGDSTRMIWGGAAKQYTLNLTDMKNPGRTFQIPLKDTVIVGRRPGEANLLIDYDKSVSGKHCAISVKNGKFYVKDLQSSNGTMLNGTRILAEMEIHPGAILTLGRLEMKVEIR